MGYRILTQRTALQLVLTAALLWMSAPSIIHAQGRGARGGPPSTAKASAPIDLTGYWTAVINEDWRLRMLTGARGDFGAGGAGTQVFPGGTGAVVTLGTGANPAFLGSIPYKLNGAQAALVWNPAKDEAEGNQCKAYGAPGIMRQPTHLHITWQDDNALKIEADYGTQSRLFHFGPPPRGGAMNYGGGIYVPPEITKLEEPPGTQPSWQGFSAASWTIMGGGRTMEKGGNLTVVTGHLKPGYYLKNGMLYSGNAVLTEHFRLMELPDGSTWITLVQIVEDPEYLTQPFVVNYQFKKLPDGSKWNPTPCSVK